MLKTAVPSLLSLLIKGLSFSDSGISEYIFLNVNALKSSFIVELG
jgi:hypothetical protein